VIGGAGWVISMSFLGFFLGKVLGPKQIEKVVYLIVLISIAPLVIGGIRRWMSGKKNSRAAGAERAPL
jgi:membrane-associated protein